MFGSMADKVDESELGKVESMINSMTRQERHSPDVINKSRAERIAGGSGRKSKDVVELVDRFKQMRDMMGSLGQNGGLLSKIPGMGQLMGGAPGADVDPGALLSGLGGPGMGPMTAGIPAPRSARANQQRKNKRQQARKSRQKGRGKKKKKK